MTTIQLFFLMIVRQGNRNFIGFAYGTQFLRQALWRAVSQYGFSRLIYFFCFFSSNRGGLIIQVWYLLLFFIIRKNSTDLFSFPYSIQCNLVRSNYRTSGNTVLPTQTILIRVFSRLLPIIRPASSFEFDMSNFKVFTEDRN